MMRIKWLVALVLLSVVLFFSSFSPPANGAELQSSEEVTVIFQFGNQQVMSVNVLLPADNHTAILATELACEDLGLTLNYSWSSYGAYVSQIGWEKNDWGGSGYYWHLMVWNNDSYKWMLSNTGASGLNLSKGDVISWVYTVDDPSWIPYTGSLAYPGHYGVWSTPRGNANNTAIGMGDNHTTDVVWKFKGSSSWGFSSTPVYGDGEIFIADSSSLYALSPGGDLLWNNSLGAAGYYGLASPVIFGNYVMIGTSDQYIRAFFVSNGTLAWESYIGEDITSAPVVGIVNKVPTLFVATFKLGSSGKLYAIDILNGTQEWNVTLRGSNYFGIPVFYEGKILVPIAGIEDTSYTWNPPYGVQCINENGTYAWNYTTDSSVRSSPAVENGKVYFTTTGGKLVSLSINGSVRWSVDIGSSVSSPAVKNAHIYVGNSNGTLYGILDEGTHASILWDSSLNGPIQGGIIYISNTIFAVTNTKNGTLYATYTDGRPLWNLTLSPADYILSSPIIADSYLLVASNNGYLYALGNNVTYPVIGNITQSSAYVGTYLKISVESSQEYQAILYYRNVSGEQYHAVWMQYENGHYVGYIPPQNSTGEVYYYITLVNSTGIAASSSLRIAQVIQPVPEMSYIAPFIVFAAFLIFLRNRARD